MGGWSLEVRGSGEEIGKRCRVRGLLMGIGVENSCVFLGENKVGILVVVVIV